MYYHEYQDSMSNGAKGTDWYNKLCLVNQECVLNGEKKTVKIFYLQIKTKVASNEGEIEIKKIKRSEKVLCSNLE